MTMWIWTKKRTWPMWLQPEPKRICSSAIRGITAKVRTKSHHRGISQNSLTKNNSGTHQRTGAFLFYFYKPKGVIIHVVRLRKAPKAVVSAGCVHCRGSKRELITKAMACIAVIRNWLSWNAVFCKTSSKKTTGISTTFVLPVMRRQKNDTRTGTIPMTGWTAVFVPSNGLTENAAKRATLSIRSWSTDWKLIIQLQQKQSVSQ